MTKMNLVRAKKVEKPMGSMRRIAMAAAVAVLAVLPAAGARGGEDEAKLIGVLRSNAGTFEKAKACQRLAVVGTREAVPVLAGLLGDEKLAHYARFGLEPIPDPSVDAALREAMGKLQGKLLVGVINSIGVRKDAKALPALEERLGSKDPDAATAAAAAMARIGTVEAAASLRKALTAAPPALRSSIGESCLVCAETLLAAWKRPEAVSLYDAVRSSEAPPHIRSAATLGAIRAREAAGIPLLVDCLNGSDPALFAVALKAGRELEWGKVTTALIEEARKLPPERAAQVIAVLGDRDDRAAVPAIVEAAKAGPREVRIAAVRALGALRDRSAGPALLAAAVDPDAKVASAAGAVLEDFEAEGIDEEIVDLLEGGGKLPPALIDLVGRRSIAAAVPALKKAADDDNDTIRLAAIRALGQSVRAEDLRILVDRLVAPREASEVAAVQDALKAACKRIPEKDACADILAAAVSSAKAPEAKIRVLEIFGSVGGKKALAAVAGCVKSPDLGTAALKVLGDWPSEEAAPELLALVKASGDAKERLAVLGSFGRVVSRVRFAKEKRLSLCTDALAIARNDDERKVVFVTLAALPAVESLAILAPYLKNSALKEEACAAAATIGERIVRYPASAAAVRDSMKAVIDAGVKAEIIERAKKVYAQAGGK
jgi:HEAT repeat protein